MEGGIPPKLEIKRDGRNPALPRGHGLDSRARRLFTGLATFAMGERGGQEGDCREGREGGGCLRREIRWDPELKRVLC